jgi:DNA polymerase-3 subunit epsilon
MSFIFSGKKPELPPYWHQYHQLNRQTVSLRMPLESLTFSVIDVESTGLNLKKDKMVAFAGIRIRNMKICIQESLDIVIRHEDPVKDDAIHIHELTSEEKETGISENNAIEEILNFIGNSILVGYQVRLDRHLINRLIKDVLGKKLLNRIIDIPDLTRRIVSPVQAIYPLHELDLKGQCEAFGIDIMDQHTAAGDAFSEAQLFIKVLSRLKKRGITNLGGLIKKRRFS